MAATATTYGARAHARAQEGAHAEAMPVVSANIDVGGTTFVTSLSCSPRGARHFTCRG